MGPPATNAEPPESPIPRIPLLGVLPSEESFDSPIDRRSDYYRQQAWQHRTHGKASPAAPQRQPLLTLPNVLTLMRLVLVPVLVLLWDVQQPWVPVTCAALFVAASLTDWLDGYLARKVRRLWGEGAFVVLCLSPVVCAPRTLATRAHKEPMMLAAAAPLK